MTENEIVSRATPPKRSIPKNERQQQAQYNHIQEDLKSARILAPRLLICHSSISLM